MQLIPVCVYPFVSPFCSYDCTTHTYKPVNASQSARCVRAILLLSDGSEGGEVNGGALHLHANYRYVCTVQCCRYIVVYSRLIPYAHRVFSLSSSLLPPQYPSIF